MQETYGPLKGSVAPEYCELGSQDSIRSFAARWLDSGRPIDVLSLNAGAQFVGDTAPRRTKEGFELTVGVNHLGHFLLANLLLPAVQASTNDPRVVVTASEVRSWIQNCHRTAAMVSERMLVAYPALLSTSTLLQSRPGEHSCFLNWEGTQSTTTGQSADR